MTAAAYGVYIYVYKNTHINKVAPAPPLPPRSMLHIAVFLRIVNTNYICCNYTSACAYICYMYLFVITYDIDSSGLGRVEALSESWGPPLPKDPIHLQPIQGNPAFEKSSLKDPAP